MSMSKEEEKSKVIVGRKDDLGKLRYGLIPPLALKELARVLTFGSLKYADNNWRKVENGESRYFDACMRHLWAWKEGEKNDEESGLPHLSHALCCISFILDKEMEDKGK